MPYRPDEIERKVFLTTMRGYDRTEVEMFLRAVAEDYADALEQAAAADVSPSAHGRARRRPSVPVTSLDLSLVMRGGSGGLTFVVRRRPGDSAARAREITALKESVAQLLQQLDEVHRRLDVLTAP